MVTIICNVQVLEMLTWHPRHFPAVSTGHCRHECAARPACGAAFPSINRY
ncbi:hypothetical protein KCP74_04215 [Salmonella enterica subsp. enterica]|nr:hypothetical protein KCP74_04215 [Salmonella enterica subsp. enterica]